MNLKEPLHVIDNKYRIYDIKTWRESVWFGDGGGWCVAESKSNFQSYIEDGTLFYVHKKTGGKWRPYLSVYHDNDPGYASKFEIAKRGNKHIKYYQLITENKELKDWLKSIGANEPWPKHFSPAQYNAEQEYNEVRRGFFNSFNQWRHISPTLGNLGLHVPRQLEAQTVDLHDPGRPIVAAIHDENDNIICSQYPYNSVGNHLTRSLTHYFSDIDLKQNIQSPVRIKTKVYIYHLGEIVNVIDVNYPHELIDNGSRDVKFCMNTIQQFI